MRGRRGPQWNQYVSIIVPATRVRVTECFPPETHSYSLQSGLLPPETFEINRNIRKSTAQASVSGAGMVGVHQLVLLSYVTTQEAQISNEKNRSPPSNVE